MVGSVRLQRDRHASGKNQTKEVSSAAPVCIIRPSAVPNVALYLAPDTECTVRVSELVSSGVVETSEYVSW